MVWQGLMPMLTGAAKQVVSNLDKTKVLFALGTAGVVGTAVTAAKASPESGRRIETIRQEDMQREDSEDGHRAYRTKRYVKEVAPLWIPCGIAIGVTVISFGMSNKQLAARAAASAAAAGVAERLLESYSEKAIEIVGEETEEKIRQAMADDIPEEVMEKARGYVTESDVANLYPHKMHDELWYDHVTGRIFWATETDIERSRADVNAKIGSESFACIADFYIGLLLETSKLEEANGWDQTDSMINTMDIRYGSKLDQTTGLVMKAIDYKTKPLFPKELQSNRIF